MAERASVVAILGGGTVGGGVVEMMASHATLMRLKYVCVRNLGAKRDFALPPHCILIGDPDAAVNDPEVDIIVELMGGVDTAWRVVQHSLHLGKHVVTANKALISKHMVELEDLLLHNADKHALFGYEAAVCGGVPVISALRHSFVADNVLSVYGIMNGTTNYILHSMETGSGSYESILRQAQDLGYAEADPSSDVLGWDARSKLCILTKLAFGITLNESDVECTGITRITVEDIRVAKSLGRSIKLIGKSYIDDAGIVRGHVFPVLVPSTHPMSAISGAMNAVCLECKYSGEQMFTGAGAGRYPTANSVMADLLGITRLKRLYGEGAQLVRADENVFRRDHRGIRFDSDFIARFFVRFQSYEEIEEIERGLSMRGIRANVEKSGMYILTDECLYSTLLQGFNGEVGSSVFIGIFW